MKTLLIITLMAAPAGAQEFQAESMAAKSLLESARAKLEIYRNDPLRRGIYTLEVNAELWKARQAALEEADPERRARLLKELDRSIDAVLAASGRELEGGPRALPPLTYDPREIRVEVEGKDIRVYRKAEPLATLRIGGAMTGRHFVVKLAGYLEASRRRAADQGRLVSIDDKAVALYNETAWINRKALEEPERFGAIIRAAGEAAPAS
ncbi:MAG: hypothetical protein NDJ72_13110 [Elusimicrobia bacterium]|nr:hypothetical protein [Elusimicrobiota bacterium]